VVLSNVADSHIMNEAKTRGAVHYMVKSETEPPEMVNMVKSVLAYGE
jgi:hypothetical protein